MEYSTLLADMLVEADKSLRGAEGVRMHRDQGRAQLLAALLDLPDAARKVIAGK